MFELGSVYPAALDVTDQNGQPVNPATATLAITLPDQTVVTPAITLPPAEQGKLRYAYLTAQPGRHLVNWVTTGPNTAYSDVFDVMTAAPPALFSLADAKQTLGIPASNTADDDELRAKIRAVTASIEQYMRTAYAYRTVTELFRRPNMSPPWNMPHALRLTTVPVITLTSLVTLNPQNVVTTTYNPAADMDVDPESGLVTRNGGPPFAGRMQAVYRAGMTIIPENITEGGRVLLQHIWESRRGPGGLNGVIGPEEMSDYRHFTGKPRKVMDLLGPPRPVIF